MTRALAAEQAPVAENIVVRKHLQRFLRVVHVLLNAEVRHPRVEVERRSHANGRQVRCAMEAGAHLMKRGEVRDTPHVRDAACMNDGRADEVDELLLNELFAIPDGIEHLTYRERRDSVTADNLERRLIVRGSGIFHPEETIRLKVAPEARGFDGREPVMHVMKQLDIRAVIDAQPLEERWNRVQVLR